MGEAHNTEPFRGTAFDGEDPICHVCGLPIRQNFIVLHCVSFGDGEHFGTTRAWVTEDQVPDRDVPHINLEGGLTGPVIHTRTCLEQFIDGLVVEAKYSV